MGNRRLYLGMGKSKRKAKPDVLGQLDILFVIDVTGSMQPYINEARKYAAEVAVKLAKDNDLDIRFGMVAYRDHPPQDTTFVTVSSDGFGSAAQLQDALVALSAAGGGDRPEAVWDGVAEAVKFDWRPKADRTIYLIGDSPPHGHAGQTDDVWPMGCPCGITADKLVTSLKRVKIEVNAFSIAGYADTTAAFELLTKPTKGLCITADRPEALTSGYTTSLEAKSSLILSNRSVMAAMADTGMTYDTASTSLGFTAAETARNAEYLAKRGIKTDK